jgi:hypothetical protein
LSDWRASTPLGAPFWAIFDGFAGSYRLIGGPLLPKRRTEPAANYVAFVQLAAIRLVAGYEPTP